MEKNTMDKMITIVSNQLIGHGWIPTLAKEFTRNELTVAGDSIVRGQEIYINASK